MHGIDGLGLRQRALSGEVRRDVIGPGHGGRDGVLPAGPQSRGGGHARGASPGHPRGHGRPLGRGEEAEVSRANAAGAHRPCGCRFRRREVE